jgi:hypothetical protein
MDIEVMLQIRRSWPSAGARVLSVAFVM